MILSPAFTSSKSGVISTKDVPLATKGSSPVFHKTCLGMDPDEVLWIFFDMLGFFGIARVAFCFASLEPQQRLQAGSVGL